VVAAMLSRYALTHVIIFMGDAQGAMYLRTTDTCVEHACSYMNRPNCAMHVRAEVDTFNGYVAP